MMRRRRRRGEGAGAGTGMGRGTTKEGVVGGLFDGGEDGGEACDEGIDGLVLAGGVIAIIDGKVGLESGVVRGKGVTEVYVVVGLAVAPRRQRGRQVEST